MPKRVKSMKNIKHTGTKSLTWGLGRKVNFSKMQREGQN